MLKEKAGEIRLEITKENNKKKTYVQSKIPLKKALEYTDGVVDLYEDAVKKGLAGASERDLLDFQVGFVADLFDDEDVTKEMLYEELDTTERQSIEDIILYRVLGNKRDENEKSPKGKKKKVD